MTSRHVFTGSCLCALSAILSAWPDPVAHAYAAIPAGAVAAAGVVGCLWKMMEKANGK